MPIRVAPTEPNPTHHFSLVNRKGKTLGLTACKGNGEPLNFYDPNLYTKNPVFTTAFKQTSGSGGYDIFDYPYSPIVQDDLSGGRAGLDFERDSTKYFDSFRTASGRPNKAYAGPLEQYVTGDHRVILQNMPGSVEWVPMLEENRYIYHRFQAETMTLDQVWLLLRRTGSPGNLTVALYSDNSGDVDTLLDSSTISAADTADVLMEWMISTVQQSLSNGTYYWLVIYSDSADTNDKHWKVAMQEGLGSYAGASFSSTPSATAYSLYYRMLEADTSKECIPFEYKEQQYFAVSAASGAPKIYMAGDRGAADSNTGNLNKLIDATKNWDTDEHAGYVVMIVDGPGKLEPQPWRTIVSNSPSELILDEDWTIEHTTSTSYVILSPQIREITGHGLTAPITDVLVSPTGVIYVCMGDSVTVRRLRAFNDSGTWKDFDNASCQADETATTKATFMVYKPQAKKIVMANNSDTNGDVSVNTNTNANIPEWGTALTWGTAVPVDDKHRLINSMIVHPDGSGNEAVWILKTDMPFILSSGNPYPAGPEEFRTVRNRKNGRNPLKHDVYLYFPLLQGLQRYYGGTYTDVGPNLGEGLPENRRGEVACAVGYPGKFMIGIDAGSTRYSSITDSGGWHERYRAPKGKRILSMTFQVVAGEVLDRLWIWQGNDLLYLPFPSSSTNELEDAAYPYAPEFSVELARMHAGMYDVQKMIRYLKLQTERLEADDEGNPLTWFELDYKLDDSSEWTKLPVTFTKSPTQEVDFTDIFGLVGKRLRFRIRGYTRDASKTPVFLAIIIFAVMRVDVKAIYGSLDVLCEDDEHIGLRESDGMSAAEKLKMLEDFGDASNDSLLLLRSVSSLFDNKMVFLNVGSRRQIRFRKPGMAGGDAYVVSISFQDA